MKKRDGELLAEAYFVGNGGIDILLDSDGNEILRRMGGSALNACIQAMRLEVDAELRTAVGFDEHGRAIIDEFAKAGMPTEGIHRMSLPTLVYTQRETNGTDVSISKNMNPATDAHTTEMVLATLPDNLDGSLVYVAGPTRKPSFMDPTYGLENFFDALRMRGATLMLDPGRAPHQTTDALRYQRAVTHISHERNLSRIDFWAMNEEEFYQYLDVQSGDRPHEITHAQIDTLTDKYVYVKAKPALFCLTFGGDGLYLRNDQGSVLVDVPPLDTHEQRTRVGLGDSTKAGMIAAILKEIEGRMSPDELSRLSVEQLRLIAAYGSAVSAHRMKNVEYGTAQAVSETIKIHAKHFDKHGLAPDYLLAA